MADVLEEILIWASLSRSRVDLVSEAQFTLRQGQDFFKVRRKCQEHELQVRVGQDKLSFPLCIEHIILEVGGEDDVDVVDRLIDRYNGV